MVGCCAGQASKNDLQTTWTLESRKALRERNALWALPVYPIFEDEKSNRSDQKSVKQKITKENHMTNLIATNVN